MELGKSQLRVCDSNYAIYFTACRSTREPVSTGNEHEGEFKRTHKMVEIGKKGNVGDI